MAYSNLIFLLLLSVTQAEASFSCRLSELLGNSKLASSEEFWKEFSAIRHSDADLEVLIKRHAPELLDAKPAVAATSVVRKPFLIHKAAEKALGKDRNSKAYARFQEFLDIMTDPKKGLEAISTHKPGADAQGARSGWHHKTLKENKNHHTVRLDDGSRILFEVRSGELHVLDIGNHITH